MRTGGTASFDVVDPITALAQAIDALGGQGATARLLGVAQPTVWRWVNKKKLLPAEHVKTVEAAPKVMAIGVDRYALRPDLFQRESSDTAASDLAPRP